MTTARGWSTAVIGTVVFLTVFLVMVDLPAWRLTLGLAALAILTLGWFTIGISRADDPQGAPLFVVVAVVATGVAVAAYPTLAILQVLVYPIAWMFMPTFRRAVVANIAVALAVAVGLLFSRGTAPDQLTQSALTVGISFAFSLAMGIWIAGMMRQGDERGRLLAELQGAQDQIAALNRDAGAAAERERLARDLHDTIAQDLTGLVMLAQRARREGGARAETLALIEESARGALAETRALVAGAAAVTGQAPDGTPADNVNLIGALERLADRFARETGVLVEVSVPQPPRLSRDAEVVVLRCAQEALANARKHARASRVSIVLEERDGRARLTVSDDGSGFDPASAHTGFGLPGMADRLALVHGELHVESAPGRGATVIAELPLDTVGA